MSCHTIPCLSLLDHRYHIMIHVYNEYIINRHTPDIHSQGTE